MHTVITIEINGRRHEVHHRALTGAEIRAIGHHEHGALYLLGRDERRFIPDDEVIELHDGERFELIEREPIWIIIEGKNYETSRRVLTGAQIKELGHQPPANRLYQIERGERILIEDDQKVHLKDGDQFITLSCTGHAS